MTSDASAADMLAELHSSLKAEHTGRRGDGTTVGPDGRFRMVLPFKEGHIGLSRFARGVPPYEEEYLFGHRHARGSRTGRVCCDSGADLAFFGGE